MNEYNLLLSKYILFTAGLCIIGVLLYLILRNPYHYPYMVVTLNISGRRNVKSEDEVDRYICENRLEPFLTHYQSVKEWKALCNSKIERSFLKPLRNSQYEEIVDDENMFIFSFVRDQTRYTQRNYVRTAYKVSTTVDQLTYSPAGIKYRYSLLKQIGFECTISEYHSKNQRKLMTKKLKEQIQLRDNFTCQNCGKYMPDGVGLHIDHIIPVAAGGKSVPSNLQVLCSKCNGRKSSKLQ